MAGLLHSKRTIIIALSATAMVAAAAGSAYAATAGPAGTTVCVNHESGVLYAARHCAQGDAPFKLSASAAPAAAASSALPVAYSGYHNSPINLPKGLGTIVSLRIPAAGDYVIFGKLTLWNGENVDDLLSCQLSAGTDVDTSQTTLTGNTVPYVNYAAIELNVVHRFAAAGSVNLACTGNGVKTQASWIKITAIKVAGLTNTGLK